MLRRKFLINKKYVKNIIIVTVVLFFATTISVFTFKYLDEKIANKAEQQIEQHLNNLNAESSKQYLEEIMLKSKLKFSKNYVQNLNFDTHITLLSESGYHRQVVDSTNHSNPLYELFTKKNLTLIENYNAIMSINSEDLIYSVNEETGDIIVEYNKEKIDVLAIDIKGATFFEDNAIFRSYTKVEYEALKRISKIEIRREFKTEENLKRANDNLIKFIIKDAKKHGINKVIINGESYTLSFLTA